MITKSFMVCQWKTMLDRKEKYVCAEGKTLFIFGIKIVVDRKEVLHGI